MPNIYHQTLTTLLSTNVMYVPKLLKTLKKWTVPCDFYKSMYVDWQYNQNAVPPKQSQGINPIVNCAPWAYYYLYS